MGHHGHDKEKAIANTIPRRCSLLDNIAARSYDAHIRYAIAVKTTRSNVNTL